MPARTLSRRIYFIFSIAALALSLWAADGVRRLAELPPNLSPAAIDYPARLGSTVVGSPAELRFLVQSRPIGSMVEIRSARETHRARLVPQLSRLHFLIVLVEGLTLFAVNLLVFWPRIERGAVRDFYWCTLLYGVAILAGGVYFPRFPSWTQAILPLTWIACMTALPVLFVHMALTFPRRREILDRRPEGIWLLATIAGALFLWQSIHTLGYFANPGPAAWKALLLPRSFAGVYLVAGVAAGCFILYRSGRTLELSREREQTKWLLWGFTIGVTPYVFLRTLPGLVGIQSHIPPAIDRIFELAIPMAFTFAVVRYRFLDIDIIIRRSLIYGILAGVLAAVYLLLVTVLGDRLIARFPAYATAIQTLAIAVPSALFWPTRKWIGGWVDRTFFQIRYSFSHAVPALETAMRQASSQTEIATIAGTFVEEQLLVRGATVLARERSSFVVSGDWAPDSAAREMVRMEGMPSSQAGIAAAPNSTSRPDLEAADFSTDLRSAGVLLLVPLRSDRSMLGVILVGPKRSERRFVEEDLQLLDHVRVEAQTALDRVELVQIATEEALEREKIQTLEAMKSDFFARVAHDLRTPLTSIRWTVENMLDGVGPPVDPSQEAPLRSILEASKQLGRLMNNLLDVSRLEDPTSAVKREAVALSSVVEEVAESLGPAAEARDVRFDLCASPSFRPVQGDRDKIHDVTANLLENAIRYSPEGGTVEIRIRSTGGRQTLTIRDHGPGLAEEDLDRVFERFQQGRPSPYSKQRGFGLGLYIVRSFVTMMGGSIEARNHPEGGACFECTLSEWVNP